MGTNTLASFIERLRSDVELQTAFTEFASQQGFTLDEDELGDADLDNVAGGVSTVGMVPSRQPYQYEPLTVEQMRRQIGLFQADEMSVPNGGEPEEVH